MKKLLALLLCGLLLTGCAPTADQPPVTTYTLTVYAPNGDATGFTESACEITELTGPGIFEALQDAGVLNADVAVNSLTVEDGQLMLDVNRAFYTQLCSYGTAGEYLMMGSVVNTLLTAYKAETVYVTCEGKVMESGHVIYDFPQSFYEGY